MGNNNSIEIQGTILSKFEFSHELFGERFYIFKLESERFSGVPDVVPVMVSEKLVLINSDSVGAKIALKGQIRTFNKHEDGKSKLHVYVFMMDFMELQENDYNSAVLTGYVCKHPTYRSTPLGREISDMLIAVNRQYGKSDYIPAIAWGRNARFAKDFEVGTNIEVKGRLQSREYLKNEETKVAYELSISLLTEMGTNL